MKAYSQENPIIQCRPFSLVHYNRLSQLSNFSCFFMSADFFVDCFPKYSIKNTIRVTNSLDPDQARRSGGPELGPNCLHRLSAEYTGRQRVKTADMKFKIKAQIRHISVL